MSWLGFKIFDYTTCFLCVRCINKLKLIFLTFSIVYAIIVHNQPISPVILISQIELLVDIDDLLGIITDDVGRKYNLVLAPHDCLVFF